MITTITFDADETLWQFAAAQQRAFARVLPSIHQISPDAAAVELADLTRWHGEFTAVSDPSMPWEERRLDAFRRTLQRLGHDDESTARRLTATYLSVRYDSIELFDDVLPTLRVLAECYALGLISNGNTRASRCGLADVFDFELYAEDYAGARKPDRRMFDAAVALTGHPPDRLAHVGDSLTQDVAGALGAGAIAVWLNRTADRADAPVLPTYEIRGLEQLAAVLGAT